MHQSYDVARSDPPLRDSLREHAARAQLQATRGNAKLVARINGVSDRMARYQLSGERNSRLSRYLELLINAMRTRGVDAHVLAVIPSVVLYRAEAASMDAGEIARSARADRRDCARLGGELVALLGSIEGEPDAAGRARIIALASQLAPRVHALIAHTQLVDDAEQER